MMYTLPVFVWSRSLINPMHCFWLSSEYYEDAVEFISVNVSSSSQASLEDRNSSNTESRMMTSTIRRKRRGLSVVPDESEQNSEYSASYL